jgi:hypothetical protein
MVIIAFTSFPPESSTEVSQFNVIGPMQTTTQTAPGADIESLDAPVILTYHECFSTPI